MIKTRFLATLCALWLVSVPLTASARDWFVSPTGTSVNAGTADAPLNLPTALGSTSPAQPGDTIWLQGGTYCGGFVSRVSGTPTAPIHVRQVPGQRATLDGRCLVIGEFEAALTTFGSDVWYWDFEITNTTLQRLGVSRRAYGINAFGPRNKYINLVIHDTGNGYGMWRACTECEVYGNLIYHNGWNVTGYSIYTQNAANTGTKRFIDNILFRPFGYNVHAYGSDATDLANLYFEGETVFDAQWGGEGWANYLIGGGRPAENPTLLNVMTYFSAFNGGGGNVVGYKSGATGVRIDGGYFAGGIAMTIWALDGLKSFTHNLVAGNIFSHPTSTANIPTNEYFDRVKPTQNRVFVRPNRYAAKRANITIYNWQLQPTVAVDLSTVLAVGDVFHIQDAQDFFGAPIASGIYNGQPIPIPMTGLVAVPHIGTVPKPAKHTAPEFGVFVVLSGDGGSVPPEDPDPIPEPEPDPDPDLEEPPPPSPPQLPPPGVPIKIMPLGDSITYGSRDPLLAGYRGPLQSLLTSAGLSFDFVGIYADGPTTIDRDHLGIPGYRIDGLAAGVPTWLPAKTPDVVLLLIGTNDVWNGTDLLNAPNRLSVLIDKILVARPTATVIVGSIPPWSDANYNVKVQAYNAAIVPLVNLKRSQGKSVHFVDIYAALTLADLADTVHPNVQGYAKIAGVWAGKIQEVITYTRKTTRSSSRNVIA